LSAQYGISNSVPVGFEGYRYYDATAMYKPDCKSAQVFKVSREYLSWLIICQGTKLVKQKSVLLNHKESTDLIMYPKCDKLTQ